MNRLSASLVHFDGPWSDDERAHIEAAVEAAEASGLPSPAPALGVPWVATRQALGNTSLYMASRDQGNSALLDQTAEGLAARIREYAEQRSAPPDPDAPTKPNALFQLVYRSTETRPMSEADIQALLETARAKNKRLDVTGLLLYAQGRFLQVLEGPEPAVRRLYATIQKDPRHTNVETLLTTTASERTFPSWDMGLERPAASADLRGLSSFLRSGTLPPGTAPNADVLEALRRFRRSASPE